MNREKLLDLLLSQVELIEMIIERDYGTKKEALINTHQFVGYIKTIEITNER